METYGRYGGGEDSPADWPEPAGGKGQHGRNVVVVFPDAVAVGYRDSLKAGYPQQGHAASSVGIQ